MKTLKGTVGALAGVAAVTLSAGASFVDLLVVDITDNTLGLSEYAVYAVFDGASDEVLTVFDANITTTTGFYHNSIGGGQQSALPYTNAMTLASDNPDADSFVTIGHSTGDGNETTLLPTFDVSAFLGGNSIGVNAGWFNIEPLNDQGVPDSRGRVLIAVLTPLNDRTGRAGIVRGTLTVGYDDGQFPPSFATASFITPAPGALGLLALAGLVGRSRRRHVE